MRLTLVVNNTAILEGGAKATFVFDEDGGTIGSGNASSWRLPDHEHSVSPQHARVFFADGHFCLEATSPAGLVINHTGRPLMPGNPFQVQDGDAVRLGRFDISAFVSENLEETFPGRRGEQWAQRFGSVETLVSDRLGGEDTASPLDAALTHRDNRISLQERIERQRRTDPLSLLHEASTATNPVSKDPLAALDHDLSPGNQDVNSKLSDYVNAIPEEANPDAIPDDLQPTSAYFAPPRVRQKDSSDRASKIGQAAVTDEMDAYLASLSSGTLSDRPVETRSNQEVAIRDGWLGGVKNDRVNSGSEEQLVDHVVLRPLCHALGLSIENMTVPEANQLAREIGSALRATVIGLMELNGEELSSRSLLAETHLHAIEDNPLRLAEKPDEAIRDLFMVQSPVHLSATAAVSESLSVLKHHQMASEKATDAALAAVLRALAPLSLARRFLKYKGHAPRTGDLDAWHWRMYQHYYGELSSDRQGGLSRMFREVFRQVYDREMRARTLES